MHTSNPITLEIRMPFYPAPSVYEKRRLFSLEDLQRAEDYVAALRREMEGCAGEYADCQVEAIHVGGGIAAHVADEALGDLLRDLRGWFPVTPDAEITWNAYPGMVSAETLYSCKKGHVTGLDIDYATADPFESDALQRFLPPSAMDVTARVLAGSTLRLSFDLLLGLPGQSEVSLQRTLEKISSYSAKEIVLHLLEEIPGTLFARELAGAYRKSTSPRRHLPDEKERTVLWQSAEKWLVKNGYEPSFPGHYALPGQASRYHHLLSGDCPRLGFGLGAFTKMDGVCAVNTQDMDYYLRHSSEPEKITSLTWQESGS